MGQNLGLLSSAHCTEHVGRMVCRFTEQCMVYVRASGETRALAHVFTLLKPRVLHRLEQKWFRMQCAWSVVDGHMDAIGSYPVQCPSAWHAAVLSGPP